MGRWLIVDGVEYRVPVVKMTRKGDILDKTANRTEDGDLHREVIGTYYNFSLELRPGKQKADLEIYNELYWKLTEPVAYHEVQLPGQPEPVKMYFGSVKDEITFIDDEETCYYKGLSCNVVCKLPSRYANG